MSESIQDKTLLEETPKLTSQEPDVTYETPEPTHKSDVTSEKQESTSQKSDVTSEKEESTSQKSDVTSEKQESTSQKSDVMSETQDTFSQRMEQTVTSGFTLAGLSLGVKLGLFDVMKSTDESMTSLELAEKAGCKERYVREWLHQMVMCDVVDVESCGKRFTLPSRRREALTAPGTMVTSFSSAFSHMFIPHTQILDCFMTDGPTGLPFDAVLPMLKEWWTPHCDENYRENADILGNSTPDMKNNLESGLRVLDIGCGGGHLLIALASRFPKSSFIGIDLSSELIEEAIVRQKAEGINNIEFLQKNSSDLPDTWHSTFDYITIRDVLHDLPYPDTVLAEIYKCLKPGGHLSVIELNTSSNPHDTWLDPVQKALGPILYITSIYHCLAASMFHPNSAGLGAGPGTECIVELVKRANFEFVEDRKISGGVNVLLLFRKH